MMILVVDKGLKITTRKKRKNENLVPTGRKCEENGRKIAKCDTPARISPPRCLFKPRKKVKSKENICEKKTNSFVDFFKAQKKTETTSYGGKSTTHLEGASQLQQGTPSLNPSKSFCLRTRPSSQSGIPEHLNIRLGNLTNHKSSPDWPRDTRNGGIQPMRGTDTNRADQPILD